MVDRSSDDGHRPERPTAELPAEPLPSITIEPPNQMPPPNQIPTTNQALRDFLDRYPRSIDSRVDEDGYHLDASRRPSSLTATIQLQSKVVRTLTVLCGEVSETLDLILAKLQCNNIRPSLLSLPNALNPPTTQPAKTTTDQRMHPTANSAQPQLQCYTDLRNQLAPVKNLKPFKNQSLLNLPFPAVLATRLSTEPRIICVHPECNGFHIAVDSTAPVWVFHAY